MDRKIISKKGFTLLELIIVIAIAGTVMTMAISKFTSVSKAASNTEDLHNISAFLKNKRLDAFTTKEEIAISINAAGDEISAVSDPGGTATLVGTVSLNNEVEPKSTTFTINSRGLFSGSSNGTIHLASSFNKSAYSCLTISDSRIRLGEWNSGTNKCDLK